MKSLDYPAEPLPEVIPVRKGTVAARVDEIEEQRARLRNLCGEIIATVMLPANRDKTVGELADRFGSWWEDAFQRLS
jgi:hypothetical protein